MKDYEYQSTLMIGALIGAAFVLLGVAMFNPRVQITSEALKGNFEVVDHYSYENRNCSVIRYENPSSGWVYFIDCAAN